MKKITLLASSLFIIACTPQPIISPVEQVEGTAITAKKNATKPKKQTSTVHNKNILYQCKNNKTVKIRKSTGKNNKQSITVEFQQTSYKLSPSVTRKSGKKYSNIRWIWTEDSKGKGTLRNKNNKILAENCVKK